MRCIVALLLVALVQLCSSGVLESTSTSLEHCVRQSQSILECVHDANEARKQMLTRIEEFEQLKEIMDAIGYEISSVKQALGQTSLRGSLEAKTQYLDEDIKLFYEYIFKNADERIQSITKTLSKWEEEIEMSISTSDKALNYLEKLCQKCSAHHQSVLQAGNCLQNMDSASAKASIEQSVEDFTAAINSQLSSLNEHLASKEKYCSMVRSHASGVVSPSLDVIKPLSEIHSIFQSISQFFTTLKNVEDELVCPEDDGQVADRLRRLMTGEKQCYTIREILSIPRLVPKELVSRASEKVDAVVKNSPSFNIFTVIPSFHSMNRVDVNQDLPSINLPLEQEISQAVDLLSNGCAADITAACQANNPSRITACRSLPLVSDEEKSSNVLVSAVRALRELESSLNLDSDNYPTSTPRSVLMGESTPRSVLTGEFDSETFESVLTSTPGFPGETEIASPVDPYAFAQPEETDFADQIPGNSYGKSILGTVSELKDLLRYLNEKELRHFFSGLRQILSLINEHEAKIIVDTLHQVILSEIHQSTNAESAEESITPTEEENDAFIPEVRALNGRKLPPGVPPPSLPPVSYWSSATTSPSSAVPTTLGSSSTSPYSSADPSTTGNDRPDFTTPGTPRKPVGGNSVSAADELAYIKQLVMKLKQQFTH